MQHARADPDLSSMESRIVVSVFTDFLSCKRAREIMSDAVLVLDFGSGFVKAGFAGNDSPSLVFPTVVGKVRHPKQSGAEPLIGEAAQASTDVVAKPPIEKAVITNENDFHSIVNYIFSTLELNKESCNVLIARPSCADTKQLASITEYFIETLRVSSISFISSATLSLLSTGRVTGIVAECGYGITNVVPIFESFGLEHARITTKVGGQEVDAYLKGMLKKIGMSENDNNAVQEVKEQLCYVRASPDAKVLDPAPYELPSGTKLMIGEERHLGAEALFHPNLVGNTDPGLSDAISTSIGRCDQFLRNDLLNNVVISGGSTMFPGIADRIYNDISRSLQASAPPSSPKVEPKIIAAPERKFAAWVGGSIMASTPVFSQFQIKKSDWESNREPIFRQKSFM